MSRKKSNRQSRQQQRRRIAFNRGIFNFQKLEKRNLLAGLAGFEMDPAVSQGSAPEVVFCSGWSSSEFTGWSSESGSESGLESSGDCQGPAPDLGDNFGGAAGGDESGPESSGDCQGTAPDGGDNFGEEDGSSGPETPGDCLPPAGGLLEDGISEGDDSSIDEPVDSGDPSDFGEVVNIMDRMTPVFKDAENFTDNGEEQTDDFGDQWDGSDLPICELPLPGTDGFVDGSGEEEPVGPSDPAGTDEIISIDLVSTGDELVYVYRSADFDRGEEPLFACTDFPMAADEMTSSDSATELSAAVWMIAANDESASSELTESEVNTDEQVSDVLFSDLDQIFAGRLDLQLSLETSTSDESLDYELPGVSNGEMDEQGMTDQFRLEALFESVLEESEA